ncbi:MAG: hypothetical protein KKE17_10970 [Proteobacteria bacterium]|nr:hypothetical protein [Pseudomonadota bacterium]MBU1710514.1 hypothetical protein [Pseudomonadota bacterium]
MKQTVKFILIIIAGYLLSGCAITHSYGPYMGMVVDKDSEEPIEGAVVFVQYFTEGMGGTSMFEGADEVLTGKEGEFLIPVNRIGTFRPLSGWDYPMFIIFKPGYGAYPGHRQSSISHYKEGHFPDKESVTIKLPRLKTREERKKNLRNIPNINAPEEKYKKLKELEKFETDLVFTQQK